MLCHVCHGEPELVPDCHPCRGTGRATSIPLCVEPWNEVVPGLWQGGTDVRNGSTTAGVVTDQFDSVVSLVGATEYGPPGDVPHRVMRFADAGLDVFLEERLDELSDHVVAEMEAGRKLLVRCTGGLNRSGLVIGLALIKQGRTPDEAIDLVRAARGPYALCNGAFVRYLRSFG
ncbi:MAG TPA: hypothetical protein VLI04_01870 [Nocardioidaceae bacterium]|nr:hypothetical protein [Nocardioidaceae bacterium]